MKLTLKGFFDICHKYSCDIDKDVFWQAKYNYYYIADFSEHGKRAFIYTDKGIVDCLDYDEFENYIKNKILFLKYRNYSKKLERIAEDF